MNTRRPAQSEGGAFYACCFVPDFPAQTLLRMRPSLRREPIAVFEVDAPEPRVCAGNPRARRRGLRDGMHRAEAELCGVIALSRRPDLEQAARAALLAIAASFTPQVEAGELHRAMVCVLQFNGPQHSAPSHILARTLRSAYRLAGFRMSIAMSVDFHTACLLAQGKPGITVVSRGAEQAALAPLLLTACQGVLALEQEQMDTLASWGVRTLGAVAMLPRKQLLAQFGSMGKRLRELARGEHLHVFAADATPPSLQDSARLEAALARLASLVGRGRIGSPVLRRGSVAGRFDLLEFGADQPGGKDQRSPAARKRRADGLE